MKTKTVGRVYYHVLKGKEHVFADEIYKMWFLNIFQQELSDEYGSIYSFCMTDDALFLISEIYDVIDYMEKIKKIQGIFRDRCSAVIHRGNNILLKLQHLILRELETMDEIAEYCRKIHQIPVEKGYVKRPEHYFWSSYITYIDQFEWKLVDNRTLIQQYQGKY